METQDDSEDETLRERVQLAHQLRNLRKQAGITGGQLAKATGMSQSKVSRIESGNIVPTVADIEAISKALKLPKNTRDHLLDELQMIPRGKSEEQMLRRLKSRSSKQEQRLLEVGFELAGAAQMLIAESLLARGTNVLSAAELRTFQAVSAWQEACADSLDGK